MSDPTEVTFSQELFAEPDPLGRWGWNGDAPLSLAFRFSDRRPAAVKDPLIVVFGRRLGGLFAWSC